MFSLPGRMVQLYESITSDLTTSDLYDLYNLVAKELKENGKIQRKKTSNGGEIRVGKRKR